MQGEGDTVEGGGKAHATYLLMWKQTPGGGSTVLPLSSVHLKGKQEDGRPGDVQ